MVGKIIYIRVNLLTATGTSQLFLCWTQSLVPVQGG